MPDFSKATIIKAFKQKDREKQNLKKQCHILWREIVFKKAKGKCEYPFCDQKATQPHHIKTKGAYPHLRYDEKNGMALCYNHHKGGKLGAHCDINFKDIIIASGVRSKEFFILLERKADSKYKLDLNLVKLDLLNEIKKYEGGKKES